MTGVQTCALPILIVLPSIGGEAARKRITDIEQLVYNLGFEITGTKELSISVGVSVYPEDGETVEDLLSEADRRMYQAKRRHHSDKTKALRA